MSRRLEGSSKSRDMLPTGINLYLFCDFISTTQQTSSQSTKQLSVNVIMSEHAFHIYIRHHLCVFCQQIPCAGERVTTGICDRGISSIYHYTDQRAVTNHVGYEGHFATFDMPEDRHTAIDVQPWRRSVNEHTSMLCLVTNCEWLPWPKYIIFHADCLKSFQVLWTTSSTMRLPPSGGDAVLKYASPLISWFPTLKDDHLYRNDTTAHHWWARALSELSKLAQRSTELGCFVSSLSSLPLEIFSQILDEGGSEMYNSSLFRHVLVYQAANMLAHEREMPKNSSSEISKPSFDFLDNTYATSAKTLDDAMYIGVDQLGVRLTDDQCPWYLRREDVEVSHEVSPSPLRPYLSKHWQGPFLHPRAKEGALELWDVPDIPRKETYRLRSPKREQGSPTLIRSIEMDGLTGLTFFCFNNELYGIHGHQSSGSSAHSTFLKINHYIRVHVDARYLPLNPGNDPITQVWSMRGKSTGTWSLAVCLQISPELTSPSNRVVVMYSKTHLGFPAQQPKSRL